MAQYKASLLYHLCGKMCERLHDEATLKKVLYQRVLLLKKSQHWHKARRILNELMEKQYTRYVLRVQVYLCVFICTNVYIFIRVVMCCVVICYLFIAYNGMVSPGGILRYLVSSTINHHSSISLLIYCISPIACYITLHDVTLRYVASQGQYAVVGGA